MDDNNNTAPVPVLEDSLGYLFRDTHRLISKQLSTRLEQAGIGLGQWYLLRSLWQDDAITQRELGNRIGMRESNVATGVRSLERLGLVEREVDPDDNRRKIVRLTAKGHEVRPHFLSIASEVNTLIAASLTGPEHAQLRALVRRVQESLSK